MQTLQTLGTGVTRNIPWFLRQPAEALVGQVCYESLVYNLNLADGPCLKHALSKGLGLGMVVGGAILKIPQIIKIVSTRSTRGLSLSAFILETLAYAITTAYSARNLFPFSQYGENAFLAVSNTVILFLFFLYARPGGGRVQPDVKGLVTCLVTSVAVTLLLSSGTLCPQPLLATLQASTVPLTVLSKAPQIISNHKLRSTGNLSAFAVFNSFFGCAARVFTTGQETGDQLIWWGYFLAAACNAVLVVQMIMYWNADGSAQGAQAATRNKNIPMGSLGYAGGRKTA